jgi:hypothetical protein
MENPASESEKPDGVCPVCAARCDALTARCPSCGAFVRDRVPALNLFHTLYMLMEDPAGAFLLIARSEQKNYVYALYAATGPALLAAALAVARIGDREVQFGLLLAALFIIGPVFGLIACTVAAWTGTLLNRILWKEKISYKLVSAFFAYASAPLAYISAILLPLALAIFGIFLFSANPSPFEIKPAVFSVLGIAAALLVAWSLFLSTKSYPSIGGKTAHGLVSTLWMFGLLAAQIIGLGMLLRMLAKV